MHTTGAGKGYAEVDLGHTQLAVINLIGRVYLPEADDPFSTADRLIEKAKQNGIKMILVDVCMECLVANTTIHLISGIAILKILLITQNIIKMKWSQSVSQEK